MEEMDDAIDQYLLLNKVGNRLRFTKVIRVDRRLFHPLYDEQTDTRCDLWLGEEQPVEAHQVRIPLLHITLYGVDGGYSIYLLPGNRLNVVIKPIKERYGFEHASRYLLAHLVDMEDPVEIFGCRTFEVSIEEVPYE